MKSVCLLINQYNILDNLNIIYDAIELINQEFNFDYTVDEVVQATIDGIVVVALVNENRVIGCSLLDIQGENGYMVKLAIDNKYRGQGYGRQLVLNSEEVMKKCGVKICYLHAINNTIAFYNSIGYSVHNDNEMYKELQ